MSKLCYTLFVGEITSSNGGKDFTWSRDEDERSRLWKARHVHFNDVKNMHPGSEVRYRISKSFTSWRILLNKI